MCTTIFVRTSKQFRKTLYFIRIYHNATYTMYTESMDLPPVIIHGRSDFPKEFHELLMIEKNSYKEEEKKLPTHKRKLRRHQLKFHLTPSCNPVTYGTDCPI